MNNDIKAIIRNTCYIICGRGKAKTKIKCHKKWKISINGIDCVILWPLFIWRGRVTQDTLWRVAGENHVEKGGGNRVEKGKGKDRRVILELGQRVKEKRLNTGIHAFKLMTSRINDNVSLFYSTRQSALQLSTDWNKSFRTNTNYW